MRYLLRTRAVQLGLGLWALGLVASITLAGTSAPTFNLFLSGFSSTRAALLLPTIVALGILAASAEVSPAQLGSARKVATLQRLAIILAVTAAGAITALALDLSDPGGEGNTLTWIIVRNLAMLVGIGLIGRRALGSVAATILPVGYVLVAMLFGDRTHRSWDIVLAETTSPAHLLLGAGVLALGLLLGCGKQADRKAARS